MSWVLFRNIVRAAVLEGEARLFVFGLHSEPLLDARVPDFIRHIKEVRRAVQVAVFTNAEFLTEDMARSLVASGLDSIKINLPSLDRDVFREINRGIDFDKVVYNVRHFIRIASGRVRITISATMTSRHGNMSESVRRLRGLGARVELNLLSNRCGALKTYLAYAAGALMRRSASTVFRNWIFPGCWFPFYAVPVTCDGKVLACCNDWSQDLILGDLRSEGLMDIWHGEAASRLRQRVVEGRYDEVPICRQCHLPRSGLWS